MSKFFVACFVFFASVTSAFAQGNSADVGLVNAMQGDVNYQGKEGPAKKAQAYMRLRHGDKVILGAGASIRISYTTVSRQESWTGPSTFVATSAGGEVIKGNKPEVVQLPAVAPQKLARIAELMNTSRVGGLVVRSVAVQTAERPCPSPRCPCSPPPAMARRPSLPVPKRRLLPAFAVFCSAVLA